MSRSTPRSNLARRDKLALAMGYVAGQGPQNVVHTLCHQVFNVSLGMNPALINILVSVQRLWSALLDPLFGQWSDNLRTPYGRRRPLLFAAAFPLAGGFAALWIFPHAWAGPGLFGYLVAASLVLFAGMSLYGVALGGIQIEVTTEYHQRTALAALLQVAFLAFTIASQWIYPFIQRFADPVIGIRRMGASVGALFLVLALIPAIWLREPRYDRVARVQNRVPLPQAFSAARKNGPFVRLVLASGAANLGFFLASFLGVYLNYYYIYPGRPGPASFMQGWLGTGFQVAAIGSIFVYRRLSARFGKRRIFQLAAGVHLASSAAKLVLFQPAHPWLQLFIYMANGAGFAGVALLAASMVADVADLEEWRTGRRSEGLYCSILSWGDKLSAGLGTLLCAAVFPAVGFASGAGAAQDPSTLRLMQWAYALFPFLGAAVAVVSLQGYRLNERSVAALKRAMQRRRRGAEPGPAEDTTPLPAICPARA